MAALRHKRTWAVLLRTDTGEFINRKQRGSVRERGRETDSPRSSKRYSVPPSILLLLHHPSTLPLVRQLLSPQNPPALLPDEAPIRPMKPDPKLLMELVKYHRFKNPWVINILGSPASFHIIPFRRTCIQNMQKHHIDVHHRWMTQCSWVSYDEVGYRQRETFYIVSFMDIKKKTTFALTWIHTAPSDFLLLLKAIVL